ncbi:MAG: hypothetical protein UZ09_BCD002002125 [Bacteroidetes bacterium OLB9]|nr:MAG: hypothetical protein UZ09_BCD002002125 [Bacteroidetes bacterium OLB9]
MRLNLIIDPACNLKTPISSSWNISNFDYPDDILYLFQKTKHLLLFYPCY